MSDITSQLPLAPAPDEDHPSTGYPGSSASAPSATPRLRLWPVVVLVALQWPLIARVQLDSAGAVWPVPRLLLGPDRRCCRVVGLVAVLQSPSLGRPHSRRAGLRCRSRRRYCFRDSTFLLMGMVIYALPTVTTAWVAWLLLTPFLNWPVRRLGLATVLLLTWGAWDLIRFDGVTGAFAAEFSFRWSPTAEDLYREGPPTGRARRKPRPPWR